MPLVTIRERIQLIIGNNDIDNENFSIVSHDTIAKDQSMPDLSLVDGQMAMQERINNADFIVLV